MKADAMKIKEGVYWVGFLDWDIQNHIMVTLWMEQHTMHILVFGKDKVALIDNTYHGKSDQMWGRIDDAFQKEGREMKVDVIIQNHVEKDHSGALPEIHQKFPEAPIYCTEVAVKGLKKSLSFPRKCRVCNS